jgi:hypothetical protein
VTVAVARVLLRRDSMKTKTALLALALLLPGTGRAQRVPDPPRVAGAVETSILELDAVVTDKDGKPVPGLKASDFRVYVRGKPVAIENFYERRTLPEERIGEPASPAPEGATAAVTAALVSAPRPPRHLVLFLDRLPL